MVRKFLLSNTTELYWVYGNSGGRNYMKLCLRIQFNGTWNSPKPMRPRVAWPRIRSLQWEIVRGNRLQEPPKHRSSGSPRYWKVRRNKAGQNIAIKRPPQRCDNQLQRWFGNFLEGEGAIIFLYGYQVMCTFEWRSRRSVKERAATLLVGYGPFFGFGDMLIFKREIR